jgi:tetratricopeptide (TPR) repeat protein
MARNRSPEAEAYLDQAMLCYKKKKNSNGMAQVEYYRASIAYTAASYEDARQHLALSLTYLEGVPERYRRWRVLLASAAAAFCMNDRDAGERFFKRALDCAPGGITLPESAIITGCPKTFWERTR